MLGQLHEVNIIMIGMDGMTDRRISFYAQTISEWIDDNEATILVVGGGANDRNIFFTLGFRNVVISNLDSRIDGNPFVPYALRFLDAENLDCKNDEFDYVIVHAALHHCASPHRALLEMYRVARRALVFFESHDSLIMKALETLGITQIHEVSAVYYNDCQYGGVKDTHIPNFIYRWTEREIEKTISSYAPHAHHNIQYKYGNDSPKTTRMRSGLKRLIIFLATPIYKGFAKIFPTQQNLFACKVDKPKLPDDLHPWLTLDRNGEIKFNKEWAEKIYKPR